jgi:SNF2 family DNA or RNA helicase
MVLSLKAGGVGLNLTEANHVVHFDRWWNPAVENQATDRAFRIGQKKNVVVHKFITQDSIEEKIDAMLVDKARMFSEVVASSGEGWITELDNDQILGLFRLGIVK